MVAPRQTVKEIVKMVPDKKVTIYLCSQGDDTFSGKSSVPSGIAWTILKTRESLQNLGYKVKILGVCDKSI